MAKRVKAGDYLKIPVGDGFAIAKVIYVSNYFHNLMAIAVLDRLFRNEANGQSLVPAEGEYLSVFYTGTQAVPRYWKPIGYAEVTESEMSMTRRIVEVRVFVGDTDCGAATTKEFSELPRMGVLGMYGVQDALMRSFATKSG